MLTTNKQSPYAYGYRPPHDLPTPPPPSRPSPPVNYQDQRRLPSLPRPHSPSSQPMSVPPRGLPPPAAMITPQHGHPPPSSAPPPSGPPQGPHPSQHQSQHQNPHPSQHPSPHPSHHQSPHPGHPEMRQAHREMPLGPLGPPPPSSSSYSQHPPPTAGGSNASGGNDETYRSWLNVKAEEEKRRQEEEKTRQESIRLEQRRQDLQILEKALHGGVPGHLIPFIFAAGGTANPQVLEWAQQTLQSFAQQQRPAQLMPAPGIMSPADRRRDSAGHSHSAGVPSTPGLQGPSGGYRFGPGSPRMGSAASIPRHPGNTPSNLPSLNTNVAGQGQSMSTAFQADQPQASPGMVFHHWQPPGASGDNSSNQPTTPSGGENPRKRKATSQAPGPMPPNVRPQTFGQGTTFVGPLRGPPNVRRHQRQQSDVSAYSSYRRTQFQQGSFSSRGGSPAHFSVGGGAAGEGTSRPETEQGYQHHQLREDVKQEPKEDQQRPPQLSQSRTRGGHAVGDLLSNEHETMSSTAPIQGSENKKPGEFGRPNQEAVQARLAREASERQEAARRQDVAPRPDT